MAYRPPRELRGRIESIRKKFENGNDAVSVRAPLPKSSIGPSTGSKNVIRPVLRVNAVKETISKVDVKDVNSPKTVPSVTEITKSKYTSTSTKGHIRRTPAFRCDKNITGRELTGIVSGKKDNAFLTTKVKIFETEQKENVNTFQSKEKPSTVGKVPLNESRSTFRSKAGAVQCVIKTITELENAKKFEDIKLAAKHAGCSNVRTSPLIDRHKTFGNGHLGNSVIELMKRDHCFDRNDIGRISTTKHEEEVSNHQFENYGDSKTDVALSDHLKPHVDENVKQNNCEVLVETNNKNIYQKTVDRNSLELNNSCGLELTNSIRVALKSPLPQGPPPKKPPRTFAHSPASKRQVLDRVSQLNFPKETIQSVPVKPQRSRTEPLLMLKKLEDALITHQQKGIAVITPRVHLPNSTVENPSPNFACKAAVQAQAAVTQTSSVLANCLTSLNCATNTNLLCCQTHFYEKPAERLSSFFVEVGPHRSKFSGEHIHYGSIQRSYSEEHIYAEPFPRAEDRSHNLQDSNQDKCSSSWRKNTKLTKSLSASVEHLNLAEPPATHDTLHYMCTPIAADVPPPAVFETINKNLLCHTIKSDTSLPSKRDQIVKQSFSAEEAPIISDGTEKDTLTGKCDIGRKQPFLRLATLAKNGVAADDNVLRSPDRFKIQLVMNQAFGSPLQGVPTTPVDEDIADLFPSLGTTSSSSSDNHDDKTEHTSRNRTEDVEETPLANADLSRLTEERKVYVRRVSSHVSQLTWRVANKNRDSRFSHLFDCALLIGLNLDCEKKVKVPYIKSKYPTQAEVPPMLEHLCFPDALEWPPEPTAQSDDLMYTLAITAEDGSRTFGYCRRVMPEGAPICLPLAYCILSSHRAHGFYSKVLQELESRHGQPELLQTAFIKELYACEFPLPGQSLRSHSTAKSTDTGLVNTIAGNLRRATDPRMEDHDLVRLFSSLSIQIVLQVFGTTLLERKVIFISNSVSKLSTCIEALETMLYPFSWQYTFIPILPSSKLEVCEAPTPYIIGVLKGKEGSKPVIKVDQGVVVDLDEGQVCCSVGDESTILPTRLRRCLKVALQLVTTQESDASRNVLISEAFLRMFVEVCGHYQTYIVTQQDGKRMFERESFIKAIQSRSVQLFLEWFTETAMFSVFINAHVEQQPEKIGVFEQRVAEHVEEMEKNTVLFLRNYKGLNKKVKTFGDRLKDWAPFS